jgi:hypothetical protein
VETPRLWWGCRNRFNQLCIWENRTLLNPKKKSRKKLEKDCRSKECFDTSLQSRHLGNGQSPSTSIINQENALEIFAYRPIRGNSFPTETTSS